MNRVIIAVGLIFLFLSCDKNDETSVTYLPDNAYPVYGSVLYQLSSVNLVVSSTDTSLNCGTLTPKLEEAGITQQILDECKSLNSEKYYFIDDALQSGGLVLVSDKEVNDASSEIDLLANYGAVAMFKFGRPVFFENNTMAMFELNYFCGPWCGNGAIVIAKKQNNVWGVEHYFVTWISK